MTIPAFIYVLLNKGTEFCSNPQDKRSIRIVNFVLYVFCLFLFPLVFIHNIIIGDIQELFLLIPIFLVALGLIRLNHFGKIQLSLIICSLFSLTIIYPITYYNETQIGTHYVSLLISFISIAFLKPSWIKKVIIGYGFITFCVIGTYQMKYKPFDMIEHLISLNFVLLVFGVFIYTTRLQYKYENLLESQNIIIKEQGEDLLKIKDEKHKQELFLKKKDLESVIANNKMQLLLKSDLLTSLRSALKSENLNQSISKIVLKLKMEVETQQKLDILETNVEDVNSKFFFELLNKHPELSKTEKEICSYIILGLSTKEIALIRNTSTNTINVTKTRLRKKLKLNSNKEIYVYLSSF